MCNTTIVQNEQFTHNAMKGSATHVYRYLYIVVIVQPQISVLCLLEVFIGGVARGRGTLGGGRVKRWWEVFVSQQLCHGLLVTQHRCTADFLPFLKETESHLMPSSIINSLILADAD